MQALVDGDILVYEWAFAAEASWKYEHEQRGEPVEAPPPWSYVEKVMEGRMEKILEEAGAEGKPFLFFTGRNNFRHHIARTQPYKDRDSAKPYHHRTVKTYLEGTYHYQEVDWLEADDLIGIAMTRSPGKYICCTRDKDLRQIPGHHYGWELGKQPAFGPELVDEFGWLLLSPKRDKCTGVGSAFFHYQLLVGDTVDTIPGVPGIGPVGAFKLLRGCTTIDQLEEAVVGAYRRAYGLDWLDRMRETGRLVYMIRERKETLIKMYNPGFLKREEWMDMITGEFIEA